MDFKMWCFNKKTLRQILRDAEILDSYAFDIKGNSKKLTLKSNACSDLHYIIQESRLLNNPDEITISIIAYLIIEGDIVEEACLYRDNSFIEISIPMIHELQLTLPAIIKEFRQAVEGSNLKFNKSSISCMEDRMSSEFKEDTVSYTDEFKEHIAPGKLICQ